MTRPADEAEEEETGSGVGGGISDRDASHGDDEDGD